MNDRAKQHSDGRGIAGVAGREDGPAVRTHLEGCAACRDEAHALQDGISRYAIATRRQAAEAQGARLAQGFAPARTPVRHRLRWIGAGALALLLAAQTAWMMKTRPAASASQAVFHPAAAATPQPAAALGHDTLGHHTMSDDELLQAVNNDLSDEVPQALAPVGAITEARNRIASEDKTRTK